MKINPFIYKELKIDEKDDVLELSFEPDENAELQHSIKEIGTFIKKNKNIKKLHISGKLINSISYLDFQQLCAIFKDEDSAIHSLSFESSEEGELPSVKYWKSLFNSLKDNKKIQKLTIGKGMLAPFERVENDINRTFVSGIWGSNLQILEMPLSVWENENKSNYMADEYRLNEEIFSSCPKDNPWRPGSLVIYQENKKFYCFDLYSKRKISLDELPSEFMDELRYELSGKKSFFTEGYILNSKYMQAAIFRILNPKGYYRNKNTKLYSTYDQMLNSKTLEFLYLVDSNGLSNKNWNGVELTLFKKLSYTRLVEILEQFIQESKKDEKTYSNLLTCLSDKAKTEDEKKKLDELVIKLLFLGLYDKTPDYNMLGPLTIWLVENTPSDGYKNILTIFLNKYTWRDFPIDLMRKIKDDDTLDQIFLHYLNVIKERVTWSLKDDKELAEKIEAVIKNNDEDARNALKKYCYKKEGKEYLFLMEMVSVYNDSFDIGLIFKLDTLLSNEKDVLGMLKSLFKKETKTEKRELINFLKRCFYIELGEEGREYLVKHIKSLEEKERKTLQAELKKDIFNRWGIQPENIELAFEIFKYDSLEFFQKTIDSSHAEIILKIYLRTIKLSCKHEGLKEELDNFLSGKSQLSVLKKYCEDKTKDTISKKITGIVLYTIFDVKEDLTYHQTCLTNILLFEKAKESRKHKKAKIEERKKIFEDLLKLDLSKLDLSQKDDQEKISILEKISVETEEEKALLMIVLQNVITTPKLILEESFYEKTISLLGDNLKDELYKNIITWLFQQIKKSTSYDKMDFVFSILEKNYGASKEKVLLDVLNELDIKEKDLDSIEKYCNEKNTTEFTLFETEKKNSTIYDGILAIIKEIKDKNKLKI